MNILNGINDLDEQFVRVEQELQNKSGISQFVSSLLLGVLTFARACLRQVSLAAVLFITIPFVVAGLNGLYYIGNDWTAFGVVLMALATGVGLVLMFSGMLNALSLSVLVITSISMALAGPGWDGWWMIGKVVTFVGWMSSILLLVVYAALYVTARSVEKLTGYWKKGLITPAINIHMLKTIASGVAWIAFAYFLMVILPFYKWNPVALPLFLGMLGTVAWMQVGWAEEPSETARWTAKKMVVVPIMSMVFGLVLLVFFHDAYIEYVGNKCEKVMVDGQVVQIDPKCEEVSSAAMSSGFFVDSMAEGLKGLVDIGGNWMRGDSPPPEWYVPSRTNASRASPKKSQTYQQRMYGKTETERLREIIGE